MNNEYQERIKQDFQEAVGRTGSDDQALQAILGFLREHLMLPSYATFVGIPVTVADIEYHGNARLGITAVVLRRNRHYRVSLLELDFSPELAFSFCQKAYRSWAGWPPPSSKESGQRRSDEFQSDNFQIHRGKQPRSGDAIAAGEDLREEEVAQPGGGSNTRELVVFSVGTRVTACRFLDGGEDASVHLSSWELLQLIPGEILTLEIRRTWNYRKQLHVSGKMLAHGLEISRLDLTPLRLTDQGEWDPHEFFEEELAGQDEEELPDYYVPILAAGVRPEFEMEQVVPGDLDPSADGPILEAVYAKDMDDPSRAEGILMNLLREDLRCLDAYAHLGNLYIDGQTKKAIRFYQTGLDVAALSFPPAFNGVLPWGLMDNRPYLRCLHGYGLCLWRLERFGKAEEVFERMLWLNPPDNQGARFLITEVREKQSWRLDGRTHPFGCSTP